MLQTLVPADSYLVTVPGLKAWRVELHHVEGATQTGRWQRPPNAEEWQAVLDAREVALDANDKEWAHRVRYNPAVVNWLRDCRETVRFRHWRGAGEEV